MLEKRRKYLSLAPPFSLAMLAALTPEDVEISLIDEDFGAIDGDKKIDIVAITVMTSTAIRAYQIADMFRERGVTVVLGGIHPSVFPEEASLHADVVVIGEAEETWPQLIEDFKAGKLKKIYYYKEPPKLNNLPIPRTNLFKRGGYILQNPVSVTRGCPFACSFCSVTSFFGHTYRFRPIEEVIEEISLRKKKKSKFDFREISKVFFFIDDNIIGRPSLAKELFKTLIPYKIKWLGQAPLIIAKDKELLKLAAESGCVGLFIGFESLNQANLHSSKKIVNRVAEYEECVREIHSYGIGIEGGFVFGFDDDDESVFEKTVRFAQKVKLELAQFTILTPYPGTEIYRELDSAGRLLTKDWSKYDTGHAVFQPKLMSSETLEKGTYWAWKEFYKTSSVFHRIGLLRNHLLDTWILNLYLKTFYRTAIFS